MISCIILGVISFLSGLLFLFAPQTLLKANQVGNRILFSDERAFLYRTVVGIILFAVAGLFFYITFYLFSHGSL